MKKHREECGTQLNTMYLYLYLLQLQLYLYLQLQLCVSRTDICSNEETTTTTTTIIIHTNLITAFCSAVISFYLMRRAYLYLLLAPLYLPVCLLCLPPSLLCLYSSSFQLLLLLFFHFYIYNTCIYVQLVYVSVSSACTTCSAL